MDGICGVLSWSCFPCLLFQNSQLLVFATLVCLSFKGFVFEKVAIIAKWLLRFSKHAEH